MTDRRRPHVRKIKSDDAGYGAPSAAQFPWLSLAHRDAPYGRGFRTQQLAFQHALRRTLGADRIVRERHDGGDHGR